ncbi:MAG: sigma-70 family RNA polymerase sigma factor [Acidobacteriota bacterium]
MSGALALIVRRSDSPEERREAFEKEALPHMDAMYALALRLTRQPRDAEDVVQETYLRAFRFFEQWEPDTNIRAWLFTILRNAFINRYRRKAAAPDSVDFDKIEETYESLIQDTVLRGHRNPEQLLLDSTVDSEVREALERLPGEYREVVWLATVEEFSYKEIARVLSIPIGTVMSRLHRGRRLLQSWLLEYGRKRGLVAREQEGGHSEESSLENLAGGEKRREAES